MPNPLRAGFLILATAGSFFFSNAIGQTPAAFPDLNAPEVWTKAQGPFSFKYDGKDSSQFLSTWQASNEAVPNSDGQIHRYYYVDPATQLKVTAEVRSFPDNPSVTDWVIRFRNDGTKDTPIIEDILPLDWKASSSGDCIVRHSRGSDSAADDFEPLEEHFGNGGNDHMESRLGRSSDKNTLPFFNLQSGDHGVICAIGWTGDWKADLALANGPNPEISMKAGMKRTHFLLHPGEEVRTPRIVLLNWKGGDWQASQNIWRRLVFAHYCPHDDGKPMLGPVLCGDWGGFPIEEKLKKVAWYHDHQIPISVFAIDAGWYGDSFGAESDPTNPWWNNRGDWFPSPKYYPNGIKPLGDALKAAGLGFSVWVKPETTMPNKKIVNDHPDWFLHSTEPVNPGVMLAKLGNPETRKGITAMLSGFITDFGMTWYRQDFNIRADDYWAQADTPDRVGMSEITHIEGLYQMWDDLLAAHPGLHIDNCSSGGRRIDIETMSRSFIFWRTDYGFKDTLAEQAMTQALAYWNPLTEGFETATSRKAEEKPGPYATPEALYLLRLGYNAGLGGFPVAYTAGEEWINFLKQSIGEYREVQPYIYGDFYPLLPYSRAADTWTLWQWDRPESKDGVVLVLRRPNSPFTTVQLPLHGIDPAAQYNVEVRPGLEKAPVKPMSGADLLKLQVDLPDAPGSALVFYKKM